MPIDKIIGINGFSQHPERVNRDSERKNHQTGDGKTQTGNENKQQSVSPVIQVEPGFNPEKLHRAAQQTKERIEDYITRAKPQAPVIEKFFPPYPPGSENRIEMLKNFPVFREQLARLTAAPDNVDYGNSTKDARIQDLEAEIKSMEIRNSLTSERSGGITVTQSRLIGL